MELFFSQETAKLKELENFLSEFNSLIDDIGIKNLSVFLKVKDLRKILKDRTKFLSFLTKNEKRIKNLMAECKQNADEGKQMVSSLIAKGISVSRLALFLGYKGNDYVEFLERLQKKKYWDYETFEKVSQIYQDPLLEQGSSVSSYLQGVEKISYVFSLLLQFFLILDGHRKKLVSVRFLFQTVYEVSEEISEIFKIPLVPTFMAFLKIVSQKIRKDVTEFFILYLKKNKQKVSQVHEWFSKEKEVREEENKKAKVCVFLLLKMFGELFTAMQKTLGDEKIEEINLSEFVKNFVLFSEVSKNKSTWKELSQDLFAKKDD